MIYCIYRWIDEVITNCRIVSNDNNLKAFFNQPFLYSSRVQSLENDLVGTRNDGCEISRGIRELSEEIFLECFGVSLDAANDG